MTGDAGPPAEIYELVRANLVRFDHVSLMEMDNDHAALQVKATFYAEGYINLPASKWRSCMDCGTFQ